jgi:large subunit ribosomal protein L37Ae
MAAKIKVGSVKRFGVRYGTRVRNKLGIVETISKKKHKCPYCNSLNVKKVSNGIFLCSKCKNKFTGRAYAPIKKVNSVELESVPDFSKIPSEEDNSEEEDYDEEEEYDTKTEEKAADDEEQGPELDYVEEEDTPAQKKIARNKAKRAEQNG